MKNRRLYSSFATILLGVLFVIFKVGVFDIMIKAAALFLAVLGLVDFLKLRWLSGIIKILLGGGVWFLGWKFLTIALYLMAAVLVVYGFSELFRALHLRRPAAVKFLAVLAPIMAIAVGLFLIFGQNIVLSWVFVATGVALILSGLLSLVK